MNNTIVISPIFRPFLALDNSLAGIGWMSTGTWNWAVWWSAFVSLDSTDIVFKSFGTLVIDLTFVSDAIF